MPRPKRDSQRKLPPPINPTAAYSRRDVLALVPALGYDGLVQEVRAGRLRESQRAGHRLIMGQWILDWVASGEVRADVA